MVVLISQSSSSFGCKMKEWISGWKKLHIYVHGIPENHMCLAEFWFMKWSHREKRFDPLLFSSRKWTYDSFKMLK